MKWFNNVKIRNKLLVIFGMLFAIIIFFSSFAVVKIKNMGVNLNTLIDSYHAREVLIADAITDIYRIRLSNMSKGYLLEQDLADTVADLQKNYNDDVQSLTNNMVNFSNYTSSDLQLTPAEQQKYITAVNEVLDLFNKYLKATVELDTAAVNQNSDEMISTFAKVIPMGTELSNKVTEIRELVFSTMQQKAAETQSVYAQTIDIIAVISVILTMLTVILLFFTVRNINLPIANLEKAVNAIANGDLNYNIRTDRKDELGVLANCISKMIGELIKYYNMTAAIDNLETMIYVTDFEYNLLYANKHLTDDYKINRQECIGQKCYKAIMHNETPCSFCKMSVLAAAEKDSFPSKDFEYLWDDSLNSWVSGNDSVIRWSDGSSVFSRSLRDSAQKKQQEEQLREALESAKNASAAKSSFLAKMSHEIRTPMNAILGFGEILSRDEELTPNAKDILDKIRNSGELLLNIINEILDLSKIEAGKLELSPAKYQVASLINDTVTLNLMRKGSKPIEFVLSVDKEIPAALVGDELRVKQILNNLLSNAFKYTQKGIVKMSVFTEAAGSGQSINLIFTVSDTGQGMTDEQVGRLFDEYSRFNGEANKAIEGTGLGMNITQNLIKMMNGKISVKSQVNWGTVFSVSLPQVKTDSEILGQDVAESLQKFELNGAKQIRKAQIVYEPMPYGSVLIVDDVESNLYVAKGLMAPYNLSIDIAQNGFDAIDKIRDGKIYDIVFMDHMMPKMDGIETVKKIRAMNYTGAIVALTANAVSGQADIFLKNGFDGFISKPIDIRQLNTVLKQYVRDKHSPEITPPEQKSIDPKIAEFFISDASRAITTLEQIRQKDRKFNEENFQSYIICVHGMKSALANIGEKELSAEAAKLEQESRNRNSAQINLDTPAFINSLHEMIKKLTILQKYDTYNLKTAEAIPVGFM